MPESNVLRLGFATTAAIAGVILAISSVGAHSTSAQTVKSSGHSVIGSLITVAKVDALKASLEQQAQAAEAAAEAQKEAAAAAAAAAARAAQEAAEAAAKAQAEAAEQADQATCSATDTPEDAAETPGADDPAEDATERAADQAEDKTEPKCVTGEGQGDSNDKNHTDNESAQGAAHENSDGSHKEGG